MRVISVFFLGVFFLGCTDANPTVSFLKNTDTFQFQTSQVVTADLSAVPFQATCSSFITGVELSFDNGATWMDSASYDSAATCSAGRFLITLSNKKAPWNATFFSGSTDIVVKFRAYSMISRDHIFRDISIRFTPSATIQQELLAGSQVQNAVGYQLKGRVRFQNQQTAAGSGVLIQGRISQ